MSLSEVASSGTKYNIGRQVVNISAPFGTTAEQIAEHLLMLKVVSDSLPEGIENYGVTQAPASTSAATDTVATPASGEVEVLPENAVAGALFKRFRLAQIVVEPRDNGMANVQFYGNDKIQPRNKYPYAQNVYKAGTWVDRLAQVATFTPEDFAAPGTFEVTADVEVRYGKPNSKGTLYRDITLIAPVAGIAVDVPVKMADTGPEGPAEPEDIPF